MDFGLARLTQTDEQAATKTIEGMVMGTAAYMSPEQAKGKAVDKRADIWAFGAVLFELITGQRAFRGEDISDTILSVLRDQPDLSKVPPRIRKLLQRCLEKEPKERLRDIGEARFLLDEPKPFNPSDPARPRRIFGIVVTVLGILTAGMGFALYRATRPVDHPLMQFSVDLGPEAIAGQRSTVALSHDGRRIVFVTKRGLATRTLDHGNPIQLSGTEGAEDPFFSPDGQWIAFFANGKLKKVPVQGGAALVLCDAVYDRGGSWGEDGNIVFTPNSVSGVNLEQVSADGGTPQQLNDQNNRLGPRWFVGGSSLRTRRCSPTRSWQLASPQ